MKVDPGDLNAFVAVARAKGFRSGARKSGSSASAYSEAVRRLEAQPGVRLPNRTTRRERFCYNDKKIREVVQCIVRPE